MSDAAYDATRPATRPTDSQPAPSGRFPRSVNWSNPRVAAILETAAQCFSAGGFTTTTLADIGRELGLRKSIVHYYFTSKATLVREVQSFAYGRYLEAIRSALIEGTDPTTTGSLTLNDVGVLSGVDIPGDGGVAGEPARDGLKKLWRILSEEKSIRGLNLELWSEGRRNPELAERAGDFEEEAQKLIAEHFQALGTAKDLNREDLATLTLAVLDGLSVREEREGNSERSSRAYSAFLSLLEK